MYHLSINAVRSEALFASALQRSDTPRAGRVQQAIARAVREFGSRGCALRVAQGISSSTWQKGDTSSTPGVFHRGIRATSAI